MTTYRIRALVLSGTILATAAAGLTAGAATASATSVTAASAPAASVPAWVRLGGVDVARACSTQHVFGSVARYRRYDDPYSWYCAAPTWPYYSLGGVDMNRACANQYGRGASAGLAAPNVYGWYCKR